MKTLIIIPTYNEGPNIVNLIQKIILVEKKADILIVDDNSPDQTGKLVDQIAAKNNQVTIIHRQCKLGLGSAYAAGFKYALKNNYDLIFEMDADLSHNPKDIPKFIQASEKADLVLGSRWIKNGQIIGWSWYRYCTSLGANIITRLLLNLKPKDITSGFRCYKRKVLENLNLNNVVSSGYAFQEEMILFTQKNHFIIKEIPIVFVDRKKGKSKMGLKEIFSSARAILKLVYLRYFK